MSVLIKNGRIITAEQDYIADIFIEKEKITTIDSALNISADNLIDASGKYVIPGGIDVHTHLDMPLGEIKSVDDFETGTKAAAFGGTTCIIDFPTQNRGTRLHKALDDWHEKAEGKAVIDYGFHMIITDLPEEHLEDLNDIVNEGVTSFKLFMAYPNTLMTDDATIFRIMKYTAKIGALICMHAENGIVIDSIVKQALKEGKNAPLYHALTRPVIAEGEAVNRSIALAEMAGVPVYIVHVSSYNALEKIVNAMDKGLPVFAETCPQYLFLSLDDMNKPGFEDAKFVITPPLREKWNQQKLWTGLKNNSLQVVSTDHCPFNFKGQKDLGKNDFTKIPNGGPGIEHRLQLIFTGGVQSGKISLNRWVEITSTSPAKLFGLYPKKGTIAVGSDADIVIWDPQKELTISAGTHHMNVDYSMYEGMKIRGNVDTVFSRGKMIIYDNKFLGKPGRGNFIRRAAFAGAWK